MRDHTKLRAFILADEVVILIYKITQSFPKSEVFGLSAQMRRAAISIPSNIVEGCTRESQIEYRRFLEIAFGSLREVHYQFGLACRLDYVINAEMEECNQKLEEAGKVLAALLRSIKTD
jgi:four helix bundle protein